MIGAIYVYSGDIEVWDTPKGTDAIHQAINMVTAEETHKDWTNYIEAVEYSNYFHDRMTADGLNGDYNEMDEMMSYFYTVMKTIIELYPRCSMDAHFCGWNRTTGTETAFTTQLRNGHVRELYFDFNDDSLRCPNPDCDNGFDTFGRVRFDTEYDCDECGRHITIDEVNEIISEYVEEYDLETNENNDVEKKVDVVSRIELDFAEKTFVTTGLSIEDEEWVKEEVESRGGEYRPRFTVSLDYLIYNPNYDHETKKYTQAQEQIEKGRPVQIITFDQFRASI